LTGETATILLVEDNPRDAELTMLALERARIANQVALARDGVEALEYLGIEGAADGQESPRLPTLVLLDLKLPRIDGLEVLARIRAHPRTALQPVVILTSSDEERDLLAGYVLHVNSYIRKPVDFTQFTEAVQQLGFYWLVLNRTPQREQR
jgi:two-component system response regulator